MFKKPSFEQEILSVLYIPDIQGRLQVIVEVAEKSNSWVAWGALLLLCTAVSVCCAAALNSGANWALRELCYEVPSAEVKCGMIPNPELMSACQTRIQTPFA